MSTALALMIALVLDAVLGEPKWLWSRAPHPAILMGRAVSWADANLNAAPNRKPKGIIALIGLCLIGWTLGSLLCALPFGGLIEILLAAVLLAQRSLVDHVSAVANALRLSLGDGRRAVAQIVGRDTHDMDQSATARAAIESAAENFSDGVIAPAFWFLLLGLPGLLVYKLVNTADSMIGYKNETYGDFGWASARFDDLINWVPARLSAMLIAISHAQIQIWPKIRKDAPLHRSPNAGWPESAMAQVLNIALAGPRSYEGEMRAFPFVNPKGQHALTPNDIDRAVTALWRAWALAFVAVAVFALLF